MTILETARGFTVNGKMPSHSVHRQMEQTHSCVINFPLLSRFRCNAIFRSGEFFPTLTVDTIIITRLNYEIIAELDRISRILFFTSAKKCELYLPFRAEETLEDIGKALFRSLFSIFEYDEETALRLYSHEFSFSRGRNPLPSYALKYRHRASGRVVVCTGDTGWSETLADFCRGAHILVAECPLSSPDEPEAEWHLCPQDIATLARSAGILEIIITNYDHRHRENITKTIRSLNPETAVHYDKHF